MPHRRLLLAALLAGCTSDPYGFGELNRDPGTRPEPPDLGPTVITDQLRQRIPAEIDVLWVIDNSQSMLREQQGIANNAETFLSTYEASGLDWHIGVVSTSMNTDEESGKLQGAAGYLWVDPSVPDPVTVFQEMAVLGRDGALSERGRAAIYAAFNDPDASEYNEGFFRPDARLSIIIVSDEDDYSRDDPDLQTFLRWLRELKPEVGMVQISAVVGLDTQCGRNEEGVDYRALVAATGGIEIDICEQDWSESLEELSNLGAGLSRSFYLTRLPDPDTLEVWVEDDGRRFDFVEGEDWDYDATQNAIVFRTYTPRASADVMVTYATLESQQADNGFE